MTTWPSAPLTVTAGQPTTFPFPSGSTPIVLGRLINLSGMALLVAAGSEAGEWVAPAGSVDVPVSGQPITAIGAQVTGAAPGPNVGQAVVTYYDPETPPTSQVGQLAIVNASGTVTVSGGNITIDGIADVAISNTALLSEVGLNFSAGGIATLAINVPAGIQSIYVYMSADAPHEDITGPVVITSSETLAVSAAALLINGGFSPYGAILDALSGEEQTLTFTGGAPFESTVWFLTVVGYSGTSAEVTGGVPLNPETVVSGSVATGADAALVTVPGSPLGLAYIVTSLTLAAYTTEPATAEAGSVQIGGAQAAKILMYGNTQAGTASVEYADGIPIFDGATVTVFAPANGESDASITYVVGV
jgi:hypothetical protein